MKELISLLPYFKKYKWLLILGFGCVLLQNVMGVYVPVLVRTAMNDVWKNIGSKHFDQLSAAIIKSSLLIILLAIIRGVFMFYMRQTIIVMSRKMEFDQRNDMYKHYQALPHSFFKTHSTGDMMARITEDVSRVRMFTGPTILYSINLVILIGMVVSVMFYVNAELAFYTLIPLPILSYTVYKVNNIINERSTAIQTQLSTLTTNSQEVFSGIRVIKSYVQENAMLNFFSKEAEEYKRRSLSLAKIESVYFPLLAFLIGISTIIVVYVGGKLIATHTITPGNMAEYILYLNMLIWPVTSLGWVVSTYQRAAVSQKRINEFMNADVEDVDGGQTATNNRFDKLNDQQQLFLKGNITLQNITVTYTNTGITAITNLSLKIKAGEKIAIIGKTGSGKTTLAQLLLKIINANQGEILFDEKLIQTISTAALRNQIGIVPQDVFLFSDTVKNNICLGVDDATNEQIIAAAKAANIHNEIMQLGNQYDTLIGERGITLSGGQKQRLSIARALIKQPTILILDDCLSAVDTTTEKIILENLERGVVGGQTPTTATSVVGICHSESIEESQSKANGEAHSPTIINITHRVMHLLHFDRIIVMDAGQIIEEGSPSQLLNQTGFFSNLYQMQQREEVVDL